VPNVVKIGQSIAETSWQRAAILDFRNSQILLADGFLGQNASLCQISSKSVYSLWSSVIFLFLRWHRPPSWICLGNIWTIHDEYLVVFITVQNLVAIGVVVSKI